jgi:hypothetical protein
MSVAVDRFVSAGYFAAPCAILVTLPSVFSAVLPASF